MTHVQGARTTSPEQDRDGTVVEVAHAGGLLLRGLTGGWGVPVAESVLAPPGPIPNPVVTQRSAGEY